jgi:REP element-mobilizing transposase RayT
MPSSYTNLQIHLVFGTKARQCWINPDLQARLYAYMAGVVRGQKCLLREINGMPDHVHLLIRIHPDVALSALVRELKSESTTWIKRTFGSRTKCGWQRGYGAFSVSHSQADTVRAYIKNQATHHRRRDFKAELATLLKLHDVTFEEAYFME